MQKITPFCNKFFLCCFCYFCCLLCPPAVKDKKLGILHKSPKVVDTFFITKNHNNLCRVTLSLTRRDLLTLKMAEILTLTHFWKNVMKSKITLIKKRAALIVAGLMLCTSAQSGTVNPRNEDLRPTGKGHGEAQQPAADNSDEPIFLDDNELYDDDTNTNASARATAKATAFAPTGYGISYHGGPLITTVAHVYYIWYGNWTGNSGNTILTNLANKIGGSPRYNINTTYANSGNVKVINSVILSGSTTVAYPYGKALTDANILSVVNTAITTKALPKDANGIYFVLTSKDVTATSGFGTQYCGWHSYATISGTNIKYAFVGDPTLIAPTSCEAQSISPNSNPGVDGMASVIVHELEETVTDPNFTGWYDSVGYENSDKCAWKFGVLSTAANGSRYNVTLGTLKYLIQQNWVNASGGYCATSY